MSKHAKRLAEHLDRPSTIDTNNLVTVQAAALRPLGDALLSPAKALSFALCVTVNVIAAGELERFRPGRAAPLAPLQQS